MRVLFESGELDENSALRSRKQVPTCLTALDAMMYMPFYFVSHLSDSPAPVSFQEPGAVFLGLSHCVSETAPFSNIVKLYVF